MKNYVIYAVRDRGVLKYKLCKKGKCFGVLTLPQLARWIDEKESASRRTRRKGGEIHWIFEKKSV